MGAACLSYIASCDFHDLILRWGGYYRLMNPALARFFMSADADGPLFPSIPYFYIPVSFFLASFLLNFPPNQVYWYHKEKQQKKGDTLMVIYKSKKTIRT